MDSSLIQFVIPLTPEGLFKSDSETRYCVTQDDISSLSEKELHKQLDSKDLIIIIVYRLY